MIGESPFTTHQVPKTINMKKIYQKPQTEVVEIEYRGMLAYSFGDPAIDPAHSREFEDLIDLQELIDNPTLIW